MEEQKKVLDEETLKNAIEVVMDKINTCTDPEELEKIKKIIKKNVPFTRRGYFSAVILREMLSSHPKEKKNERNTRVLREDKRTKNNQPLKSHEESEKKERVIPEGAKTLYLNVGKMKHLYAKNLSILLQKELGIKREDIYLLRVHDKYSFITMSEENCEKAIRALNGKDINGREAQLSYSTK